ncbi:hypothetical protein P154DRAFT_114003 [Amniculicola lignicola CBS 123094]|uniref:Uncharacterized protein n=1 Tax=Amniculicola lignicola CBS 123094 TaxID=1392246 RepID=A0A6A5VVM8_9PLEO|nr:hypothetical protein P154DRAFT_114003 [Amniculicola lignicola CBS 123094]
MSVGQSHSSNQSGTYGASNTSQLPPQQGTNNGTSQAQNSHSPQNGIADTSDSPSASIIDFMGLSADAENLDLHNAIARGAHPNGGGETHPAVESASNVSTLSANRYGPQRPFTMASSLTTPMTATDREEMGLVGYSHLPPFSVRDLQLGQPSEEMITMLERLSYYLEDEASNAAPGEGPTASSQAD